MGEVQQVNGYHPELRAQAFAALAQVRKSSSTNLKKTQQQIKTLDRHTTLSLKLRVCELTGKPCVEHGCDDADAKELCPVCQRYMADGLPKEAP